MATFFIVVAFHEGIGHTLQNGGVLSWNFQRKIKMYKSLETAKKTAHKVNAKWMCQSVKVYEIEEGEYISASMFKKWDDKVRYAINNN